MGKQLIWGLVKSWVWQQRLSPTLPPPQATWVRLQSLALTRAKSTNFSPSSAEQRWHNYSREWQGEGQAASSQQEARGEGALVPWVVMVSHPEAQKSPWDPNP